MIGVYCFTNFEEILYVGSSKNIRERYSQHKSDCHNENSNRYHLIFYQYIREHNINLKDLNFIILKEFDYYDKNILEKYERNYIEILKPKFNKIIPLRTKKEYYNENIEYFREYFLKHKDEIKIYKKLYYLKNREYYEKNKDEINRKRRERYYKNKL